MKKIISVIIITTTIIILAQFAFADVIIGDLDYWYSDSSKIGKWYSTELKYQLRKLDNDYQYSDLDLSNAVDAWDTVFDMSLEKVTSGGDIDVYTGTLENIQTEEPSFSSTSSGLCTSSWYYEGIYMYNSSQKRRYSMASATVYVATDNYLEVYCTILHELGHSLGWDGHSADSNQVMYHTENAQYDLQYQDIYHISQIY